MSQFPDTTPGDDDPEIAAISAEFLAKLPDRARAIAAEQVAGRLPELARLAHKLVGAASCFGFTDLAGAARRVEDLAKAGGNADALAAAIVALTDLCTRRRT